MNYGHCSWPEIEQADKNKVVVQPLASLEQHGHHAPLLTDTILVTSVAEGVHERLQDEIYLLPALWLGASQHHLDFPGTVSVPNQLYSEIIKSMARSFVRAGFRRIFFLNGHGGNTVPGTHALTELTGESDECNDAYLALVDYWTLAQPAMEPARHGMETPRLTHSCEYETSMMLFLQGELIDMSRARATPPVVDTPFYHSEQGGRVNMARRFNRLVGTGAMGRPEFATAEKGASLLEAIVEEVAAFVQDFAAWPELAELRASSLF